MSFESQLKFDKVVKIIISMAYVWISWYIPLVFGVSSDRNSYMFRALYSNL